MACNLDPTLFIGHSFHICGGHICTCSGYNSNHNSEARPLGIISISQIHSPSGYTNKTLILNFTFPVCFRQQGMILYLTYWPVPALKTLISFLSLLFYMLNNFSMYQVVTDFWILLYMYCPVAGCYYTSFCTEHTCSLYMSITESS